MLNHRLIDPPREPESFIKADIQFLKMHAENKKIKLEFLFFKRNSRNKKKGFYN